MINLEKGQRISMDKGLSLVGVGLGWDPNEGTGFDFDLDAAAFMLGSNGQIPAQEYFVFYNNMKSPDGSVETTGDDLTGGNSDGGDDETLNVDLTKVSPQIQEIVFTASGSGCPCRIDVVVLVLQLNDVPGMTAASTGTAIAAIAGNYAGIQSGLQCHPVEQDGVALAYGGPVHQRSIARVF